MGISSLFTSDPDFTDDFYQSSRWKKLPVADAQISKALLIYFINFAELLDISPNYHCLQFCQTYLHSILWRLYYEILFDLLNVTDKASLRCLTFIHLHKSTLRKRNILIFISINLDSITQSQ